MINISIKYSYSYVNTFFIQESDLKLLEFEMQHIFPCTQICVDIII